MFEALLARIALQLESAGIPYMVIGGQAVFLYGEPRLTKDIDVTLGATLDRLPEVVELVEALGLERARHIELAGATVRFASLEDVIIHKVIAGRPRDLEDVKGMLIKNSDADLDCINTWLRDFADSLGEPFSERFETILADSR